MAEEQKERWLNYLALTTVCLAVCATLATFKGGGYSTRSVIAQAQASDQWAFFQARSIKESLHNLQKERLELDIETLPATTPAKIRADYEQALTTTNERIAKYDGEKKEVQTKALALEQERDEAKRHGAPFGFAVIFLQVAILISSIAGLMKRKVIWQLALPVGVLGLVYFADGFFLFLP